MPRYSDADILDALQRAAADVDGTLTAAAYREWRDDGNPTVRTIINRSDDDLNPWVTALAAAGVLEDPAAHSGFRWSRYDCSNGIYYVTGQDAAWPTGYRYRQVYRRDNLQGIFPSRGTIQRIYGTWADAVETTRERMTSLETLIDDGPHRLTHSNQSYGHPSGIELFHPGDIGRGVHYLPGHEQRTVVEAFLDENPGLVDRRGVRSVHKRISELGAGWGEAVRTVLQERYPDEDLFSHLGRAADQQPHRYSDGELVEAVRECSDGPASELSSYEYQQWAEDHPDRPSQQTVSRRFGSWQDVIDAAEK
jgi:hypothetical protein